MLFRSEAVRKADIKVLEYSHSAGNESYRRKLVSYYKKAGIDITHEQILVTTGGSEAIQFGFFACFDAGDEVIIPEPFYANYNGFACAAGVKVVPVTASIDTGEPQPIGLAASLYDGLKTLTHEGSVTLHERDCPTRERVGIDAALGQVALRDDARRDRAAVPLHDEQFAREATCLQLALEAIDVPREDRLHARVDRGGDRGDDEDEKREAANPRNFQRADNLVFELNRRGKLTDAVLLEFVKDRKYEEMTATLALFCGVKSDFIERILKSNDQKELIVACKAANLNWATVELILKTQFSYRPLSEKELGGAKDSFLELTREAAQRSIRFLQTQDATKQSD